MRQIEAMTRRGLAEQATNARIWKAAFRSYKPPRRIARKVREGEQ